MRPLFSRGLALAALACAAPAFADDPKPATKVDPKPGEVRAVFVFGNAEAEEPAQRYWIGLNCVPITPDVRAQLPLPEGKGIAVDAVFPDSPASKAGLKRHDVLISAGDKELATLEDLSKEIQAKGKAELTLTFYRAGQKQTITVTPAEVPAVHPFKEGEIPRVFTKRLPPGGPEGAPFQFSIVRPGIAIDIGRPVDLPEDVSVTMTKQGKSPAKIQVKRGDKTWDVEEGKLDQLPEDVAPWVRRALGTPGGVGHVEFEKHIQGPPDVLFRRFEAGRPFGAIKVAPENAGKPAAPQDVEQRLEETLKQLEALRKSVEELRSTVKKPEAPQ